ncbi:MAG: biopolymer transporter ExbD [Candidatus Accumulibacter sp.]|jgi:biopolymer transport protein ExbD|nr:biopolymer transporter ExbD [Accumulibacter sp.]
MAFHSRSEQRATLAEINMIPLIDVMLVLLIIFIVAAPLLTQAVKVELPRADSVPAQAKPETVRLSITADGRLYWNGEETSEDALDALMAETAARVAAPEIHIEADAATRYEILARVMARSARMGLGRIGFVSRSGDR